MAQRNNIQEYSRIYRQRWISFPEAKYDWKSYMVTETCMCTCWEQKNLFLIMWNQCDTIKVHLILIVAIHICTSEPCSCSDLSLFKYVTDYKFILYVILFPPSPLWCIYLNLFFLFFVTSWSCLTTMFGHSFNASRMYTI